MNAHFIHVFCPHELDGQKLHQHPLSDPDAQSLKNAKRKLDRILDQECLLDHVNESLMAFKTSLYSQNLRSLLGSTSQIFDRNYQHEVRSGLNRHAFNILNFGKLYLDKHCYAGKKESFVKNVTDCTSSHQKVLDLYEAQYDSNHGYVLGCELRNYVQHSTLPINKVSMGVCSNESGKVAKFTVPIDISSLEDSSIKKGILMRFKGGELDLHSILDEYVQAINKFHHLNRELTSKVMEENLAVFSSISEMVENTYPPNDGIVSLHVNKSRGHDRLFSLNLEWFETTEYLMKKNHGNLNFGDFEFSQYMNKNGLV